MSTVAITISKVAAIFGAFILIYGVCSLVIKRKLYISEAFIAVLCGIAIGPVGLNWLNIEDPSLKEDATRQFSRAVIAIQVMAAGVTLPKAYLHKEGISLLIFLGPILGCMWIMSGLCVWVIVPGLTFLESLLIASCFTPTDPVLASSIVQGHFAEKYVPANIRNIIVAESAANDGLGYPFLFIAVYLMEMPTFDAIFKWSWYVMGYEIGFSILIGFVVGYLARRVLKFSVKRQWIDKESFLVFAIALALFLMGAVDLLGSDDLLACFIAGNSFTWDDWFREETEDAHLVEVTDMLLNLSIFIYVGITMPWSLFNNTVTQLTLTRLIYLAVAVLLLRRMPFVLAFYKYVPAVANWKQAVFVGWFGPIGISALFYYTIVVQYFQTTGLQSRVMQLIEPIVYFLVLSSVIVHGVTVPFYFLASKTLASRSITEIKNLATRTKYYGSTDAV